MHTSAEFTPLFIHTWLKHMREDARAKFEAALLLTKQVYGARDPSHPHVET